MTKSSLNENVIFKIRLIILFNMIKQNCAEIELKYVESVFGFESTLSNNTASLPPMRNCCYSHTPTHSSFSFSRFPASGSDMIKACLRRRSPVATKYLGSLSVLVKRTVFNSTFYISSIERFYSNGKKSTGKMAYPVRDPASEQLNDYKKKLKVRS